MNIFQIIFLSIIEGLTEFLPVSSTAHLIIFSKIIGIKQTDFLKFFEVFIQSGAILSVIFLFFKKIFKDKKLLINILISFIPTAFIGFIFHKVIKNIFFDYLKLIIFSLFFVGCFFIFFEWLIKKKKIVLKKTVNQISLLEAIFIGLFQSLAVIPGVSRAGAVILAMLILGYQREEAVFYSFLLAVPTILSAGLFDLYQSKEILLSGFNYFFSLFLGFFVSFIFAYFSISWLIGYLKKNNLIVFGIYRILIAIIISLLLFL